MHEFELIKKYFSKLSKKSQSSLNLNDDVFFDKLNNIVVSVDTFIISLSIYVILYGLIIFFIGHRLIK